MESGEYAQLERRVEELEHLARALFRALETYITVADLYRQPPPEGR